MKNQNLNLKGHLLIRVIEVASNKVLQAVEEQNLVLTAGHKNIANLLGGDPSGKAITKIGLGVNGTQAQLTDTALSNPFIKQISSVSYPEANSIKFDWAIDASEANGMTVREFGLLNENDVLCSRKARTDIVKTPAVRLVGTWKIIINS